MDKIQEDSLNQQWWRNTKVENRWENRPANTCEQDYWSGHEYWSWVL